MRGELSSGARLEDPAAARMELSATNGPGWKKERWPELKKGQKSGPDHSFHRRERAQRAAPSLPHLGATGTHPGAAIPLQLENSVGNGRGDVVELLLSALSRCQRRTKLSLFRRC